MDLTRVNQNVSPRASVLGQTPNPKLERSAEGAERGRRTGGNIPIEGRKEVEEYAQRERCPYIHRDDARARA